VGRPLTPIARAAQIEEVRALPLAAQRKVKELQRK
jgi:hypothetical protein